jgi:hypothetical protein
MKSNPIYVLYQWTQYNNEDEEVVDIIKYFDTLSDVLEYTIDEGDNKCSLYCEKQLNDFDECEVKSTRNYQLMITTTDLFEHYYGNVNDNILQLNYNNDFNNDFNQNPYPPH